MRRVEDVPMTQSQSTGLPMPDVQALRDTRLVAIDRVGVKDVVYPMRLATAEGGEQSTIATINMYVALPHHQKGTHMSRFLEVLNEHAGDQSCAPLTPSKIPVLTRAIKERLEAEEAHFSANFTYFISKPAPVTGVRGLMNYEVTFECMANGTDDLVMTVAAPATSLCPCSKEISQYGAHNQRCRIEAKIRTHGPMLWIEQLVTLLEAAASVPVFAVLKRPDEKWVTEKAYENPKFVEDIVRDLSIAMQADERIAWYSINSENYESIHSHNAYAQITRDKRA